MNTWSIKTFTEATKGDGKYGVPECWFEPCQYSPLCLRVHYARFCDGVFAARRRGESKVLRHSKIETGAEFVAARVVGFAGSGLETSQIGRPSDMQVLILMGNKRPFLKAHLQGWAGHKE